MTKLKRFIESPLYIFVLYPIEFMLTVWLISYLLGMDYFKVWVVLGCIDLVFHWMGQALEE
jgi:hypothetical protein